MRFQLIIALLISLIGCINHSESIGFSVLNQNGNTTKISQKTDIRLIINQLELNHNRNFRKLIFTQSNGDNLIIEQKDEDEFLVLLKIRYEQFVIDEKPKTIKEVINIIARYLKEKDRIMDEIKFH